MLTGGARLSRSGSFVKRRRACRVPGAEGATARGSIERRALVLDDEGVVHGARSADGDDSRVRDEGRCRDTIVCLEEALLGASA